MRRQSLKERKTAQERKKKKRRQQNSECNGNKTTQTSKKGTVAASARWCVLHERMGINLQ
jgi:hypothetical protein